MADPIGMKDSDSCLNKNQLSKPNQYQSQHHEMKKRESDRFAILFIYFFIPIYLHSQQIIQDRFVIGDVIYVCVRKERKRDEYESRQFCLSYLKTCVTVFPQAKEVEMLQCHLIVIALYNIIFAQIELKQIFYPHKAFTRHLFLVTI